MKDKVVVITGAKGGLGTFVTNTFLTASAKVIGISRSIKSSDFSSENFTAIPSDITNSAAASEVVQQVLKQFGRIDVLAHIAGGFAFSLVHDIDDATRADILAVLGHVWYSTLVAWANGRSDFSFVTNELERATRALVEPHYR
jgi:NADP-dependent 3-hydroxy acid dehydrogenase YdfG